MLLTASPTQAVFLKNKSKNGENVCVLVNPKRVPLTYGKNMRDFLSSLLAKWNIVVITTVLPDNVPKNFHIYSFSCDNFEEINNVDTDIMLIFPEFNPSAIRRDYDKKNIQVILDAK